MLESAGNSLSQKRKTFSYQNLWSVARWIQILFECCTCRVVHNQLATASRQSHPRNRLISAVVISSHGHTLNEQLCHSQFRINHLLCLMRTRSSEARGRSQRSCHVDRSPTANRGQGGRNLRPAITPNHITALLHCLGTRHPVLQSNTYDSHSRC